MVLKVMTDPEVTSFVIWSIITGILMGVTGLTYRSYLKKKK